MDMSKTEGVIIVLGSLLIIFTMLYGSVQVLGLEFTYGN